MPTRIYKTADEALEAANLEIERLQYEWDMQRYSAFGVPIDKSRLNAPTQFAYEKHPHHNWPETLQPDYDYWEHFGGGQRPESQIQMIENLFNPSTATTFAGIGIPESQG